MKNYNVKIWLIVNAARDIDKVTPELRLWEKEINAVSESDAIQKAKAIEDSSLSIWESEAEEIY